MPNMPIRLLRTGPMPAISNCSIRKAAQPRKNLAFPTEFFISSDFMPLEGSDQLHLRAAHGYIELEMFEEAQCGTGGDRSVLPASA